MSTVIPIPLSLLCLEETVGFKYLLGMQAAHSGIIVPVSPGVLHWCISAMNTLRKSSSDSASLIEATTFLEKVYAATKEHPFPVCKEDAGDSRDKDTDVFELENKIEELFKRAEGLDRICDSLERRFARIEDQLVDADIFSISDVSEVPQMPSSHSSDISTGRVDEVNTDDVHHHDGDDAASSAETSNWPVDHEAGTPNEGDHEAPSPEAAGSDDDWSGSTTPTQSEQAKAEQPGTPVPATEQQPRRTTNTLEHVQKLRAILNGHRIAPEDRSFLQDQLDLVEARIMELVRDENTHIAPASTPKPGGPEKKPRFDPFPKVAYYEPSEEHDVQTAGTSGESSEAVASAPHTPPHVPEVTLHNGDGATTHDPDGRPPPPISQQRYPLPFRPMSPPRHPRHPMENSPNDYHHQVYNHFSPTMNHNAPNNALFARPYFGISHPSGGPGSLYSKHSPAQQRHDGYAPGYTGSYNGDESDRGSQWSAVSYSSAPFKPAHTRAPFNPNPAPPAYDPNWPTFIVKPRTEYIEEVERPEFGGW